MSLLEHELYIESQSILVIATQYLEMPDGHFYLRTDQVLKNMFQPITLI